MNEQAALDGRLCTGFGEEVVTPPVATSTTPSPIVMALATSVMSAATGWAIDAVARRVRGRKK